LHGLIFGKVLPGIGTKVIASENYSGGVKTDARRNGLYKSAKIGRRHAGVTAFLIDLIAGRLDEDAPARVNPQEQGGLDDSRMGGANRGDAGPAVSQSLAYEWREGSSHDNGFPE
jgi:hypothetical protein